MSCSSHCSCKPRKAHKQKTGQCCSTHSVPHPTPNPNHWRASTHHQRAQCVERCYAQLSTGPHDSTQHLSYAHTHSQLHPFVVHPAQTGHCWCWPSCANLPADLASSRQPPTTTAAHLATKIVVDCPAHPKQAAVLNSARKRTYHQRCMPECTAVVSDDLANACHVAHKCIQPDQPFKCKLLRA
jgi:hypothetical protein